MFKVKFKINIWILWMGFEVTNKKNVWVFLVFFSVGPHKKNPRVFWVRTRVSEPCRILHWASHGDAASSLTFPWLSILVQVSELPVTNFLITGISIDSPVDFAKKRLNNVNLYWYRYRTGTPLKSICIYSPIDFNEKPENPVSEPLSQ